MIQANITIMSVKLKINLRARSYGNYNVFAVHSTNNSVKRRINVKIGPSEYRGLLQRVKENSTVAFWPLVMLFDILMRRSYKII